MIWLVNQIIKKGSYAIFYKFYKKKEEYKKFVVWSKSNMS